MSTRSHIGIKEGNKVRYIYCHSDGYLSYNGVFLNLFYRDLDKVRALINLGDISSIGFNIEAPRKFNGFHEASLIHLYMNIHIKTSWVLSYDRDGNTSQESNAARVCSYSKYIKGGQAYNYLFDTDSNKWYVINVVKGVPKLYSLDTIFGDKEKFQEYKMETDDNENFEVIYEIIEDWKLDLSKDPNRSIIYQYNEFLQKKKIYDIEFDYARDKNGKRVYAILTTQRSPHGRRKVLLRSACIGDLLKTILEKYGKSFWTE